MLEAKDLTVVTTTFRNDADLALTLGSLKESGIVGCEVIIADGVEKPQSKVADVITAAGLHPSITVRHLHGPDAGPYHAMNRGILHSTRQWLWFMNSGDQFCPTSPALYETAVQSDALWAVGRSWLEQANTPMPPFDGSPASLLRGETPCHQAVLFNHEGFAKVGLYDLRYRIGADYDVMLGFSRLGEPARTDSAVCIYQGGGMSDVQKFRGQVEYQHARQRRGVHGLTQLPVAWARVGRRYFALRRNAQTSA